MKETSFIEQNKKKWNRFEQLYNASSSSDPEELSDLYMDITDDLSYAQTFYKRRTVRVYLNQLAQKVYTGVHKQKGESIKKFFNVWRVSLPLEIYRSRKNLLFAFVLFLIYATIGAITTHNDPGFLDEVTGAGYSQMTAENIAKGDPLGVYRENPEDQMEMFLGITTNNLRVAFMTFFFGFFFSIGSHILLFTNSVMVGSFQYYFFTKGVLITSFLGIWIHGAFEISAIVLAAGAGITAGNGLLFPGSYTRMQSLQLSTKRGIKIMLSLVPFIIMAGFLESYVTANYKDLPDWSKWTLILLSFGIILFFYVFYPMYVARKHPELLHKEEAVNFGDRTPVKFDKIRNVGEIIADAFKLYRTQFGKFARINMLITFPIIVIVVMLQNIAHYDLQQTEYYFDWASQLEFIIGYGFRNLQDVLVTAFWTLIFTFIYVSVFWTVKTRDEKFSWSSFWGYCRRRFFAVWLGNIFISLIVLTLPYYVLLILLFAMPLLLLIGPSMGLGEGSFGQRFSRGWKYSAQHYGNGLLIMLILLLLVAIAAQPIASVFSIYNYNDEPTIMSDLLDVVANFIKRITQIYFEDYMIWANVFRQLVYVLFLLAVLPVLIMCTALSFYSEEEKHEAKALRKAFEKFGKRSRSRETKADFD